MYSYGGDDGRRGNQRGALRRRRLRHPLGRGRPVGPGQQGVDHGQGYGYSHSYGYGYGGFRQHLLGVLGQGLPVLPPPGRGLRPSHLRGVRRRKRRGERYQGSTLENAPFFGTSESPAAPPARGAVLREGAVCGGCHTATSRRARGPGDGKGRAGGTTRLGRAHPFPHARLRDLSRGLPAAGAEARQETPARGPRHAVDARDPPGPSRPCLVENRAAVTAASGQSKRQAIELRRLVFIHHTWTAGGKKRLVRSERPRSIGPTGSLDQ